MYRMRSQSMQILTSKLGILSYSNGNIANVPNNGLISTLKLA